MAMLSGSLDWRCLRSPKSQKPILRQKCAWNKDEKVKVQNQKYLTSVSLLWSQLWFAAWRRNKTVAERIQIQVEIWCGARGPVEWMSMYLFHSLFFYPSILSRLTILTSPNCRPAIRTHLHFRVRGKPVRHPEDPPLMFQRSAAWDHNFPSSVVRGAKALNCCLEILTGS